MQWVSKVLSAVVRLVVVTVGLVFGAFVLVAGMVLALCLVLWSLLRGRRPQVMRFRMNPGQGFGRTPGGRTGTHDDVVDIEAREVPEAPRQLTEKAGTREG